MLTTQIIVLIILIIFSAFFSGIETALVSLNMIKVKALLKQKKKGADALYRIKKHPRRLIITILIGNNLVNIGAAAFATVVFTDLFGSAGVGVATGVMTFLILIFGEITPKTFAAQNAERISLKIAKPIEWLSIVLTPFVWFFGLIARAMSRLLGSKEEGQLSQEELKTIVTMGRQQGLLDKEAAEMMQNVLKFEGTKVTEIMVPISAVDMVEGTKKLQQVLNFVVRSPFSRFPVHGDNRNKIQGILDVDDVLKYAKNKKLHVKVKEITRKPFFVPETKEIDDLLAEFEHRKIRLAIVVDEYGTVMGIVTLVDILEEIVGNIFDKSQKKSAYMKKVDDKILQVDARTSIQEINKLLNLGLKSEHFTTIAGFVQYKLKRMPQKGEQIKLRKIIIEVDKVTNQQIKSVKIIKI